MQELQYLYGVPPRDRKRLKPILERAALEAEGSVVPLRPILKPEFLLFGYTTMAQCHGYKQRGEYFFDTKVSDKLADIVIRELEALAPTLELAPARVHRLRYDAMDHVNFVVKSHTHYEKEADIPLRDVAAHINHLALERARDGQMDLSYILSGIACTLEAAYEPAEIVQFLR